MTPGWFLQSFIHCMDNIFKVWTVTINCFPSNESLTSRGCLWLCSCGTHGHKVHSHFFGNGILRRNKYVCNQFSLRVEYKSNTNNQIQSVPAALQGSCIAAGALSQQSWLDQRPHSAFTACQTMRHRGAWERKSQWEKWDHLPRCRWPSPDGGRSEADTAKKSRRLNCPARELPEQAKPGNWPNSVVSEKLQP